MSPPTSPPSTRPRLVLGYAALLVVSALAAWFVVARAATTPAPSPDAHAPVDASNGHASLLLHVLLCLAAVTLVARFFGGVFRRYLGQPAVMGEILAGLLLGPSVLGALWPAAYGYLLPASTAPFLGVIAKIGVVLFMFLVGLELDPRHVRGNAARLALISHASIVMPFALGTLVAAWSYEHYAPAGTTFPVFALFLGVSLSVTAFPVLARILHDRRVQSTTLGSAAMACAAIGDVTAWVILALVAGVASAQGTATLQTVLYVLAYGLFMWVAVRPLLARFVAHVEASATPLSHTNQAIVLSALLLSAAATEAIGIHALFGAFLLGAMIPHDGRLAEGVRARLQDVVVVLFLPAFFVVTGMRTQLGLLSDARDWAVCAGIVAVATLGKFGGTYVAARWSGLAVRRSAALGILMNTRGLMELIVLNLGLDLGVLSPSLFAMLVLMALVTTFATTPLLDWVLGPRGFEDDVAR